MVIKDMLQVEEQHMRKKMEKEYLLMELHILLIQSQCKLPQQHRMKESLVVEYTWMEVISKFQLMVSNILLIQSALRKQILKNQIPKPWLPYLLQLELLELLALLVCSLTMKMTKRLPLVVFSTTLTLSLLRNKNQINNKLGSRVITI